MTDVATAVDDLEQLAKAILERPPEYPSAYEGEVRTLISALVAATDAHPDTFPSAAMGEIIGGELEPDLYRLLGTKPSGGRTLDELYSYVLRGLNKIRHYLR